MQERGKEHPLQTGVLFKRTCTPDIPKIQHRHQHDGRCQGLEVLAIVEKSFFKYAETKKIDLRDLVKKTPRVRGARSCLYDRDPISTHVYGA